MTTTEQFADAMRRIGENPHLRAVTYFWQVWREVLREWQRGRKPGAYPAPAEERLFLMVLGALEIRAYQEDQDRTRQDVWQEALQSALVMYGADADRDEVFTILRAWALVDEEDRWAAALPPCDAECQQQPQSGEFSQIRHTIGCSRGLAWRMRYKLDQQ
jgi:hypothetical protein